MWKYQEGVPEDSPFQNATNSPSQDQHRCPARQLFRSHLRWNYAPLHQRPCIGAGTTPSLSEAGTMRWQPYPSQSDSKAQGHRRTGRFWSTPSVVGKSPSCSSHKVAVHKATVGVAMPCSLPCIPSAQHPRADPEVAARDELSTVVREEDGGVRKATGLGRKRHRQRQLKAAVKTGESEFAVSLTAAEPRRGLFLPRGIDAAQCALLGCRSARPSSHAKNWPRTSPHATR